MMSLFFRIINSKRLKMSAPNVVRQEAQPSQVEIQVEPQVLETAQGRAILGLKQGGFGENISEFSTPDPTEVAQEEQALLQAQQEQAMLEAQRAGREATMVSEKPSFFSRIPEISPATTGIIAGVSGAVLAGLPYVAYEIGKDVVNLFSKKNEISEEEKKDKKDIIVVQPVVSPSFQNIFAPEQKISSSVSLRPYRRRKGRHQSKKK